ncbi:hypothetical protein A4A49_12321 [Nicotiana attenuata]|uniref:Uncharacterized protein n=1 Tax=Nicotiana attenuata TaxID=49451 RepID=A0A314KQ90_NICAT|nr:hypothetical protein A4A49_12321 [Nicotiana attenuata]
MVLSTYAAGQQVLDALTPNGNRAQSSTEQAADLKDPKATDGTKVLEFPTEIIVQQQLVHVHDQPAVVPAELFEKIAGSKTTALNRVSQVCDGEKQVSKDPTADRVSDQGYTQVCRGFKSIAVHDERQELKCVDVLDSVAATGDKTMLEQAENCPNSPSDQANDGLNLGCDVASEVQNKLPEVHVRVAGENTLFSNNADFAATVGTEQQEENRKHLRTTEFTN